MQSDRDALLAGILADPDADLPRLVFADWLEETGHPANCARAEYIRLAIRRAELHRSGTTRLKLLKRLDTRLSVLDRMFDDGWASFAKTIPSVVRLPHRRPRGFISSLTSVPTDLINAEFRHLIRTHPVIELVLHGVPIVPDALSGICLPVALRRLKVSHFRNGGLALAALLEEATVPRLRSVTATACDITDAEVVRLVHALRSNGSLPHIESLNLAGNPLTDHSAHTLAAAELAPTFRFLVIEGTRITNAGREVLFRRFGFEELRPRLALS